LKAQHVSSGIPLIIRSSKLCLQLLVYIPMWWPAVVKAEWEFHFIHFPPSLWVENGCISTESSMMHESMNIKCISLSLWNVLPALQTEVSVVGAGQVLARRHVAAPWPTEFDFLMTGKQAVFKMVPPSPPLSFFYSPSPILQVEWDALWDKRRRLETQLDVIKTDGGWTSGRALSRKLC